tara:strand:+ start:50 stop:334 length:285 start_codon:yes stop_codon:yes gene_type:complete
VPARTNKSAQLSLLPYFFLIGQSKRRALSKLTLSGHEFRGAKRWLPVEALPLPPQTGSNQQPEHSLSNILPSNHSNSFNHEKKTVILFIDITIS